MPKIVSRSVISSSDGPSSTTGAGNAAAGGSTQPLRIFYCLCGDFALVCDQSLDELPKRPLDGARVMRCLDSPKGAKKTTFKLSARQGKQVMLRRPDGTLEKQHRFHCSRCDLPLGYEVTPPPLKSGKFTYILPGALT